MSDDKNSEVVEVVEKVASTLAGVVPQLFFDVIARIIPGSFIAILFIFLTPISLTFTNIALNYAQLKDSALFGFFIFCCLLSSFYVIAIIFYGIWELFIMTMCTIFPDNLLKKLNESLGIPFEIDGRLKKQFSLRYDYIKLKAPIAGSRITKLKAEAHMTGTLASAFIVLLVAAKGYAFVWLTLGFLGSFIFHAYFLRVLKRSVDSYSVLLGYKAAKYHVPDYSDVDEPLP